MKVAPDSETETETAATGSLGPVAAKLAALLGSEYKLRRQTRRDLNFIKSKFKSMHSFLWATWGREVLDEVSKELKIEALVLSDDVDDAVDDFILTMEPSRRSKRLVQTKTKASPFEDFKRRADDVSGRFHTKWKKKKKTAQPICSLFSRNKAIFSPRKSTPRAHPYVRKDASQLVAMDEQQKKLVEFLIGEDAESKLLPPKLKMVSILGMAGMGKTTLADLVYEEIKQKFQAQAFVSVTPGGNVKEVLAGILEQVAAGTEAATEEHHLIDKISDLLKHKRYLVIIDDIWQWEEWETIRKSLPENNLGSRVVTTTRINDVAEKWHDALIHRMHPEFDREKRWVYKIGTTDDVCAEMIAMNADKVGKGCDYKHPVVLMCGGMPLSAIGKEREKLAQQGVHIETRDVQDMIEKQVVRHGIQSTPGFEPLVESLHLGYNELPHHMLKSCLLYCSVYPEDHGYSRGDTVKRWMDEGLAHKVEAGESYYAELLGRGLISRMEFEYEYFTRCCYRMHPMMRNFLRWKSHEDDFITYMSGIQSASPIRRLCIDSFPSSSDAVEPLSAGIDWSHVRSLVVFKDAECVPYKHLQCLRLLDVQPTRSLENHHLKDMCGLHRVRHLLLLGQDGSRLTEMPSEIAKLERLETLEVRETFISELPGEIGCLQQLRTLVVQGNDLTVLPSELGGLQKLITLDMSENRRLQELPREIFGLKGLRNLNASSTGISEVPKEIGRLQQLRNLNMCDTMIAELPKEMMELQNLENLDMRDTEVDKIHWKRGGLKALKSLQVYTYSSAVTLPLEICQISELVRLPECIHTARTNSQVWSSLAAERLSYQKTTETMYEGGLVVGAKQMGIPPWIKDHFKDLGMLDIRVCKLEEEDLKILREMPKLWALTLRFEVVPKEPVAISGEGFAALLYFLVDSRVPRVTFQEGAMPRLDTLSFHIQFYGGPPIKDPLGIRHLRNLENVVIECNQDWYRTDSPCIRATIDVVCKEARRKHVDVRIPEGCIYEYGPCRVDSDEEGEAEDGSSSSQKGEAEDGSSTSEQAEKEDEAGEDSNSVTGEIKEGQA